MSAQPLRVLCLDIEGGFGGSSRSLFQSVKHLDREAVRVEVWCKRRGPIQEGYAGLGTPCRVFPAMPKVSALPRLSRNLLAHARYWMESARARGFRAELAARARLADRIESLMSPGLTVLSPDGGEIWRRGETRSITWQASAPAGNVIIELLQNDTVAGTICSSTPASAGSYTWVVGQMVSGTCPPGSSLKIRVRSL